MRGKTQNPTTMLEQCLTEMVSRFLRGLETKFTQSEFRKIIQGFGSPDYCSLHTFKITVPLD